MMKSKNTILTLILSLTLFMSCQKTKTERKLDGYSWELVEYRQDGKLFTVDGPDKLSYWFENFVLNFHKDPLKRNMNVTTTENWGYLKNLDPKYFLNIFGKNGAFELREYLFDFQPVFVNNKRDLHGKGYFNFWGRDYLGSSSLNITEMKYGFEKEGGETYFYMKSQGPNKYLNVELGNDSTSTDSGEFKFKRIKLQNK